MFTKYFALLLLLPPNILSASAAVHSHSVDTAERESDGAYRPRDYEHYNDAGHNVEFDHEAILGSVKEAEIYDNLSAAEARMRLSQLLPEMDVNGDQIIDRQELKKWILRSFAKLSKEEAEERLSEADSNKDGVLTWGEYLQDAFGVDSEEDLDPDDNEDTGMLVQEEKKMWRTADANGDGRLDSSEFEMFSNPEEHSVMHQHLLDQTLREKDKDGDGQLDFSEYLGDRGGHESKEWMVAEQDKFDNDLDMDRDGILNHAEILRWLIPDNEEVADEEVEHLFSAADVNRDGQLTFAEILERRHVFVGSAGDREPYDEL